jgi:integrase
MMRRRKTNRHLPQCMYLKHGRYYHVIDGKWHPLSRDYAEALSQYARRTKQASGIGELIDRTLEAADVKPNTMRQYQQVAGKIKEAFIEFDPDQVKPRHIAAFLDHNRKTPAMANRMRSVLKIAFNNAVRWGLCDSNPVIGIEPFKERGRGHKYLSDEDYLAIRSSARKHIALMMDLAYLTGQRVGDIITLKSSDIKDGAVYFEQQKTGQRVAVEINDAIAEALRAVRALRKAKGIYLFHTGRGEPYSYYSVADGFRKARDKAGVTDVQFRDIRAKSATDAEAEGLNPGILLGHRNPQTTNRYLRKRRTMKAVGPQRVGNGN